MRTYIPPEICEIIVLEDCPILAVSQDIEDWVNDDEVIDF